MKKYEFTGKEINHFGVTLRQIVCVSSFGSVSKGEVGGYIENESNLSHDGNAWVCGNAEVYGDDEVCTLEAYTISTDMHHVTITDTHMTIGCQNNKIEFWRKATFNQIEEMDGTESAENFMKYKDFILMLADQRNKN